MEFREYADRDMLELGLASVLGGELTNALQQPGDVLFVVPGGTTPAPVFDVLCAVNLEWERVTVAPTDERWVSEDSPRSNARLIREHLLVERAAQAKFLSLYTGAPTPEEAFGELVEKIEPLLPISVALLGMGEDMHVASLFPGCKNLASALRDEAPDLLPMHPPGQPEARITLTAPVLNGALSKHLVITGEAKRSALEKAREIGDPLQAPVLAVLDGAVVHWAA